MKTQIRKIELMTGAGDNLETVKKDAKELATLYTCKVVFEHNNRKYLCDSEGNLANID